MPPWSPASSEGSTGMVPYSRRIRGSVSRRDLRVINLDLQNNPKIRGLLLTIRGSWILRPKEQSTKDLTPFDLGDILGVIARRLATVTRNLILRRSRYCNEKNTSLERQEGEAVPFLRPTLRGGRRHFEACKFRKSGTGPWPSGASVVGLAPHSGSKECASAHARALKCPVRSTVDKL